MRLEEFANAEDQLELWTLVTQSVITAIDKLLVPQPSSA